MPGGDKTGPQGDGSMTGRRLGFCMEYDRSGFYTESKNYRRGFGRGNRWRGQMEYSQRNAFGHFSQEEVQSVSKRTLLENNARILKEQLASIEKQISEINKGTD